MSVGCRPSAMTVRDSIKRGSAHSSMVRTTWGFTTVPLPEVEVRDTWGLTTFLVPETVDPISLNKYPWPDRPCAQYLEPGTPGVWVFENNADGHRVEWRWFDAKNEDGTPPSSAKFGTPSDHVVWGPGLIDGCLLIMGDRRGSFEPRPPEIPPAVRVGMRGDGTCALVRKGYAAKTLDFSWIFVDLASLDVPAGHYDRVAHFRFSTRVRGESRSETVDWWFAPGVGLVQRGSSTEKGLWQLRAYVDASKSSKR